MSKRKRFKTEFVIGVSGLAGLLILFLLQCYSGKPSIRGIEPLSTFQSQPETQRLWVKLPTAINTPQQNANKTERGQSEATKNTSTATNASSTVLALDKEDLDKEDTIQSLVNSRCDEDIEGLKELTWKDFLLDKERDDVNRQIVKYLKETAAVVSRMIECRSLASELETALYLMQISGPLHQTSRDEQKRIKTKIDEVYDELDSLQRRVSELDGFLLDEEIISVGGDLIDADKIEQTFNELACGRGWSWYKPGHE